MKLTKKHWFILSFSLFYILAYGLYYISIKNYEFMWYILVLMFFFFLIFITLPKTKFDYPILWGLSIWGLLHMSGGGIVVNGDVLYNYVVLPLFQLGGNSVLKFDQIVHMFGFGVTTLVAFHILKPYLKNSNYKVIYPLLVFVAMGAGALNEIVEFMAVVMIPNTNVGGYYNTALDLISNTIGSMIAIIVIHFRRK